MRHGQGVAVSGASYHAGFGTGCMCVTPHGRYLADIVPQLMLRSARACVIVAKILVKFYKGGKGGKLNAMHGADTQ